MMECSHSYITCRIAEWLWRLVPLLLVIGTVGNVINIIILSRRPLRRYSTSVYFIILAVSDTLALWSVLPDATFRFLLGVDYLSLTVLHCRLTAWIAYSSAAMSTWTITNLTAERVLLTLIPVRAKTKLTPKVSFIVSLVTFVVIQPFTVHLIFAHAMVNPASIDLNTTLYYTGKRCILVTQEYRDFMETTWNCIILFIFNVVPMAIIISGNAIISRYLFKQTRRVFPHGNGNPIRLTREKLAVKMLFGVSCFFILCTSPYCIYFVVKSYQPGEHSPGQKAVDALINVIVHIMLLSNFTFNFVLYFARSMLFRKEWKLVMVSMGTRISVIRQRIWRQSQTTDIYMVDIAGQ